MNSDSNANPPPNLPRVPDGGSELPEDYQSNNSGIPNAVAAASVPNVDNISIEVDEIPIF